MTRSPFGPPFWPRCPPPATRQMRPSSQPAGMAFMSAGPMARRPCAHAGQEYEVTVPRPRQPGQMMRTRIIRSEEHTSELQSLMRISYAVFCLKKKKQQNMITHKHTEKQSKQNSH